jgi:uncharacterized protein (DUF1810 family)
VWQRSKNKKCHGPIDEQIEIYRLKGYEVPYRKLLKTKQQIEGIREAANETSLYWISLQIMRLMESPRKSLTGLSSKKPRNWEAFQQHSILTDTLRACVSQLMMLYVMVSPLIVYSCETAIL